MSTLTPEQFLAQPSDPEDEDLTEPAAPLESIAESIAESLRTIVARMERVEAEEREEDHLQELVDQLDRELGEKVALIDQVLEVCRPSTSKLADRVRAVLQPADVIDAPAQAAPVSEAEEPAPAAGAPADDAPVEVWRGYARGLGYAGSDVDTMNRSQIRTMLGIPQPAAV